jgi:hypothetical protein
MSVSIGAPTPFEVCLALHGESQQRVRAGEAELLADLKLSGAGQR